MWRTTPCRLDIQLPVVSVPTEPIKESPRVTIQCSRVWLPISASLVPRDSVVMSRYLCDRQCMFATPAGCAIHKIIVGSWDGTHDKEASSSLPFSPALWTTFRSVERDNGPAW